MMIYFFKLWILLFRTTNSCQFLAEHILWGFFSLRKTVLEMQKL